MRLSAAGVLPHVHGHNPAVSRQCPGYSPLPYLGRVGVQPSSQAGGVAEGPALVACVEVQLRQAPHLLPDAGADAARRPHQANVAVRMGEGGGLHS